MLEFTPLRERHTPIQTRPTCRRARKRSLDASQVCAAVHTAGPLPPLLTQSPWPGAQSPPVLSTSGNSCLACPKGCTACHGSTLVCEAHKCISCAEGLVHTPVVPGLRFGRCLRRCSTKCDCCPRAQRGRPHLSAPHHPPIAASPGYKKTCPPFIKGCSDANQWCVAPPVVASAGKGRRHLPPPTPDNVR